MNRISPWRRAVKSLSAFFIGAALAHAQPAVPTERTLVLAKGNQLVMMIGHYVPGSGWKQATERYISTDPGDVFTLFRVDGPMEEVRVVDSFRSLPDSVPAGWSATIKRREKRPDVALGLRGEWMGTSPLQSNTRVVEDPEAIPIVTGYLKSKGYDVQTPHITQALRISLDDATKTYTLVCARSLAPEMTEADPGNVYSVALLRADQAPERKPYILFSQTSHKPHRRTRGDHETRHGTQDTVQVLGVLDIDGDGAQELVLHRRVDGADVVNVFTFRKEHLRRVLEAYKPPYI